MAGWRDADFDSFVAARMPALVRFAYVLTGDLGHAEDVVQTALLKSYLATRRRAPDVPEAYVRRAIVGANLSRHRRKRVTELLTGALPEPRRTEENVDRLEVVQDVGMRLASLTPRQRTVVVLRYVEDWTEAEIAAAMGVSPGTVKTLAHRALARLREEGHTAGHQITGRRS